MDAYTLYFVFQLGLRQELIKEQMLTKDACLDAMERVVFEDIAAIDKPVFCLGALGEVIRYVRSN